MNKLREKIFRIIGVLLGATMLITSMPLGSVLGDEKSVSLADIVVSDSTIAATAQSTDQTTSSQSADNTQTLPVATPSPTSIESTTDVTSGAATQATSSVPSGTTSVAPTTSATTPTTEPTTTPTTTPTMDPTKTPTTTPSVAPTTEPTTSQPVVTPAPANLELGASGLGIDFSSIAPAFGSGMKKSKMMSQSVVTSTVASTPELNLAKTISTNTTTPQGNDGRTFNLNLSGTTKVSTVTSIPPCDIILVLDRSGSMADGSPSKISLLKTAANNFVDSVVSVSPDSTVSVVSFASLRYENYAYFDYQNLTYYVRQGSKWVQTSSWEYVFVGYVAYGTTGFSFNLSGGDTQGTYVTGGHTYYVFTDGHAGSYTQVSGGRVQLFSTDYSNNTTSNYAVMNVSPTVLSSTGNVNTIKTAINGLNASGATRSDTGLASAAQALNLTNYSAVPTRQKYVIFFTDGVPTSSSIFDPAVASAAVSNANILKNPATYRASIFSVGVFATIPASGSNIDNFMRDVASDPDSKYYITTTDPSQLNSIFQSIVTIIGSNLNNAVVQDVISSTFEVINPTTGLALQIGDTIPGTNGAYLALDVNGNQVVRWSSVTIPAELDQNGNPQTPWTSGSITIRAKTDFVGGNYVPTNATGTGVYVDNQEIGTFTTPHANVAIKPPVDGSKDITVYKKEYLTLDLNQMAQTLDGSHASPATNIFPNFAQNNPLYPVYGSYTKAWHLDNISTPPLASTTITPAVNTPYNVMTYVYRIVYVPYASPLTPAEKAAAIANHTLAGTEVTATQIYLGTLRVHVVTGTITIAKTVTAAYDSNTHASVYKITRSYTPASIQNDIGTKVQSTVTETFFEEIDGNGQKVLSDLPIGTYSVLDESDPASTNWTWRYNIDNLATLTQTASLSGAQTNGGTVSYHDDRHIPYWLSDVAKASNLSNG